MSVVGEVRLSRQIHPGLRIDVDFALTGGPTILFGASGAGKTSLLRLIAGLDRPDRGLVRLDDRVLLDTDRGIRLPLRRRRIGMVFQDDLLFPHLDVARNVGFGLTHLPRAVAARRVAEVAELCGIDGLLGRHPRSLSGGERQRVGLARALAPRPRLLLCDEPVSALDLSARFALVGRLRAIQERESLPILTVTHGVDEALAFGDRLLRMDRGRIVADGPPVEILSTTAPDATPVPWEGVRNVFLTTVESHRPDEAATLIRLKDGTPLTISSLKAPVGTSLTIGIGADEILLARERPEGLSARNILPGRVLKVIDQGPDAEVLVIVGGLVWVVGVVRGTVATLGLRVDEEVWMIVKARSCRVLGAG
ncbi:ATP-binding cassette domain-containing protein [Tundrisphaera sp. TA3]|uniref:ATP-binding cassette domain-containing protein n=1 Tax=Tundrisphaera sp. TA3 TaxID=3435775 RepID=UPI003EBA3D07